MVGRSCLLFFSDRERVWYRNHDFCLIDVYFLPLFASFVTSTPHRGRISSVGARQP